MSTVRLRRLTADNAKLRDYVRRHPRVRLLQAEGDPPERYQIEYRIKSLRMVGADLQEVQSHIVEVVLPRNYPRTPPQCRMLSPVFHPNIAPHAICVGDHWGAGESLESIIIRIGEMLAYQTYNVKSPLNGEAARWVEQNKHRVPLDPVSLLPEEDTGQNGAEHQPSQPKTSPVATSPVATSTTSPTPSAASPASASPRAASPTPKTADSPVVRPTPTVTATNGQSTQPANPPEPAKPPEQVRVACPQCQAAYSVATSFLGKRVRCQKCGEVFVCAAPSSDPPNSN